MLARSLAALLFAAAAACAPATFAQAWPTQPIKVIVGFPPGGVADAIPRYLQSVLKDSLGQPIVVENKPGGAGIIAMEAIAKATDNHTVGIMTLQNLIVPATGASLSYDARKDLVGIVLFGKTASVLTVHTSLPVKSVRSSSLTRRRTRASSRSPPAATRPASTSPRRACASAPTSTSSTSRTRASRPRTPTFSRAGCR